MVGALVCLIAGSAHADPVDDYQQALELYRSGDYRQAAQELERLVQGPDPLLVNPIFIVDARKYLAAAYMFNERNDLADVQFERIFRSDPDQYFDPQIFPASVVQRSQSVRERVQEQLREEREARERAEEEERRRQAEALLRDRARFETLLELAQTETVVEERSRWIAALPFGVGQFHLGNEGLGWFFAVAEGVLLLATVGTAIGYQALDDPGGPASDPLPSDFEAAEAALRIGNQVSFAALLATAAAGILHAQITFEPYEKRTRRRELDPDLRRAIDGEAEVDLPADEPAPEARLGVGPGGVSFSLTF